MDWVGGTVWGGFPAFALEAKELLFVIAPAELGQFAGKREKVFLLGEVSGSLGGDALDAAAEGDRERRRNPVGDGNFIGVFGQVGGALDKVADPLAGFLITEPILIAPLFPFAEVLLGNFPALEMGGQDGADVVTGVEPNHELLAGLALFEAQVEFFADGAGEAGDFAGAGHSPNLAFPRRPSKDWVGWVGNGGWVGLVGGCAGVGRGLRTRLS